MSQVCSSWTAYMNLGLVRRRGVDRTGEPFRHAALVADWGLSYLAHERTIIEDLPRRIDEGT